ncbi:Protein VERNALIZATION INSENSITIVE 3 [Rhynchospora pubera]|uniref:Protein VERNALIZATION INSENSITIVE 3 n=1 Tax=Rhynchospora pubera TaxID=906938 RepID=A0AAV8FFT2_9POAL|nr:Protein VERNALIZATION INSENSITIVE 3 [Rhynchospora pubera]
MESSYSGSASEAEEHSNDLSLEKKRELVYELSKVPNDARELLQSWTRKELIQLVCFESGKDRKYSGRPKAKMINQLLKLIARKSITRNYRQDANEENPGAKDATFDESICDNAFCRALLSVGDSYCKRCKHGESVGPVTEDPDQHQDFVELVDTNLPNVLKRKATDLDRDVKADHPKRKSNKENHRGKNGKLDQLVCENVACRAKLNIGHMYCKRCSCCVCCKFDENKDPSLWLVCSSDPPFTDESCGATCHLRCALKHEKFCIWKKSECSERLDGAFYCVFCGKVNSLLGCLRKQLSAAISARRVDALCERLFLSNKMLKGTEGYKEIEKAVSLGVAKLKKEVGPLDNVSAANARCIVNRLNCGPEVQKLCSSALEALDQMLGCQLGIETTNSKPKHLGSHAFQIQLKEVTHSSVTISLLASEVMFEEKILGCSILYQNLNSMGYPEKLNCFILNHETIIPISGLTPSTEYYFKACPFSSTREFGTWEVKCMTQSLAGLSDPGFRKEPTRDLDSQKGSTNSSDNNNSPPKNASVVSLPLMESNSCVLEMELVPSKPKKADTPIFEPRNKSAEQQYEYCVKAIRWLEYEGYMQRELRVKFLTWFSVKATDQERRVVSTFIDVLIDDPASLVAQLMDAFMDGICGKEKPVDKRVFFAKFWH